MRAKEFIIERKLPARKSGPLKAAYAAYRFGMAMANHEIKYTEGPTSNSAVIIAYTPEEEEIIQAGTRKTGHKGQMVADKESHEPGSTGTQSPVAKLKPNRFGV
jgi:hypothetical protein